MPDMLVKLYELPPLAPVLEDMKAKNIIIRRPIGPENYNVRDWIRENFRERWAGETENAFFRPTKSVFIAIRHNPGEPPEMLGFACYDACMKGMFGPTGVAQSERKQGIGGALLLACLHAMWDEGYAYAVIGGAGPVDFYKKVCGAVAIENSEPGVYRDMLP